MTHRSVRFHPTALLLAIFFLINFIPEQRLCCYGQSHQPEEQGSVFDNIGKYIMTAGETLNNIVYGIDSVIQVIDNAIDEDCEFVCRNGGKPIANPYYKPESNGCGSLGYQITKQELPVGQLTRCCDEHDICYDTCAEPKDDCDSRFKRCLYAMCTKHADDSRDTFSTKRCKAAAKMMFLGTMALGCKPYKDAQKKACYCETNHKKFDKEL